MIETNCKQSSYLLLNTDCKQIILIKDYNSEGAILCSDKGALSLNNKSLNIMLKLLVSTISYSIEDVITTESDLLWFNDLLKNDLFILSSNKPCKKLLTNYSIEDIKKIPVCFLSQPFIFNSKEYMTEVLFNDIVIYYVSPNENFVKNEIDNTSTASAFIYTDYSSSIYPSVDISSSANIILNLHPLSTAQPLSSSCQYCTSCTTCQVCSACFLTPPMLVILAAIANNCSATVTGCNA